MRYVPWNELNGRPNIVVDGYPAEGTVLTLSHWRGSGSPEELADDLSTQIAFRYLDRPELAVDVDAVSNNHFDEDGLCGIYAVLSPAEAQRHRNLLIQAASSGDFDTFSDRAGARLAFAIGAFADEGRSPLDRMVFDRPYPQVAAALYEEMLGRLPELLDVPERFRALWQPEDAWLGRDEARLASGKIGIVERPEIDLAIVTLAGEPDEGALDVEGSLLGCHASAVNNATRRHRVLAIRGREYVVRYRYETWVRYVSAPTMPRVDLSPLAEELTTREGAGKWVFDGVEDITPSLHLEGADESDIPPDSFVAAVEAFLSR